ncbi:MAG: stage III sporulation protein AE [Roseburia sp.]|nr:stage III sporulation protein AE [Roseburia sp.]
MRKNSVAAVCLFILLILLIPSPVLAAETDGRMGETPEETGEGYLDRFMGELDFTELDELIDTELFPAQQEKIRFSDVVEKLLTDGADGFDASIVKEWIFDALFYEMDAGKTLMVEAVLLAVGFSLLKNFSGAFKQAYISEICFLLVYGILAVLLLQSFAIFEEIAAEAISGSVDFMKALIPTFCVSMVFSSGPESSAGFYQLAFLVIYLVQWLFLKVLIPLIQIYVVLELFNHFFEDEKFQNLTELVYGAVNWGMKSAGVLVLGLNAVQSMLSPAKDRLTSGAVSQAAAFVPGVGNLLNGVGELILGAGILIKNCVGVAALLFLLVIGLAPVLKILGMSVIYKLAAAVSEPVADKRIAGCMRGMAQGGMLYLKLVIYCLALFFVTIALTTAASGFMR